MEGHNKKSKEKQSHLNKDKQEHKLHYQVFLQEDRPIQPKDEDEIEY